MLDHRERVIEVVETRLPRAILRRAAKAFGVILKPLPLYKEEVAAGPLQAALQLMSNVAGRAGDDR